MENWNLPGQWELAIKKKKLRKKTQLQSPAVLDNEYLSPSWDQTHQSWRSPLQWSPLPTRTVGYVQSEGAKDSWGLSPTPTTLLMQLWDANVGTTLVELVLLQLPQSRGREQGVPGRKGRLHPHLLLGCQLVIWSTGEGVILGKISLVKSCFSNQAVAGKGKMGLLSPRWHTLGKVVVNRRWGDLGKLLGNRTADRRPAEVGCFSCRSGS